MKIKTSSLMRWWRIDAAGLIACALVTLLCVFTLIRPAISNRQAYEQLKPEVTQRDQQVKEARAALDNLQTELDTTRVQLESLPLRLESPARVNSRLADLADLASQMGLEVHQMLPAKVRAGTRYDIVPITLSGSGDFAQVTQFMRGVHDNYADIAVVRFDLSSLNPGSDASKFDIGLAWYTLPVMGLVEN